MRLIFFLILSVSIIRTAYCNTSYSVSDGLSNSSVKAIFQDSVGYMWFGTKNGLNRFDGYEFKKYYYQQDGQRQKNDIVSINADRKGQMWIGTFNGITLFNPYKGEFIDLRSQYDGNFPVGVVVGIWIAENEDVWIATKRGLYRFHNGVCESIDRFKNQYINSMSYCGDNNVIIDVVGEGLILFDTESGDASPVPGGDAGRRAPVNCSLFDGNAATWLFVEAGHILHYDRLTKTAKTVDVKIPEERWTGNNQVHCAVRLNKDSLLLAADAGVMVFNTKTNIVSHYFEREGGRPRSPVTQSRIMSIFKDRTNSLWIGTFEDGISFHNPRLYSIGLIQLDDGNKKMPVRIISDIVEVDGKLIAGYRRGISVINLTDESVENIDVGRLIENERGESEIFNISKLSDQKILIYILNVGTFVFDPNNRTLKKVYSTMSSTSQVRTIEEDAEGNLWVAADELCCVDKRTGEVSRELSTNHNGYTRYMLTQDIYRETNGDMLVGTRNNGIWRYPYQKQDSCKYFKAERINPSVPDDANVSAILVDGKDHIWVGTYDSGIYMCSKDGRNSRVFNTENGLPHNTVYGIVEDTEGHIWISTLSGLAVIDNAKLSIISYTQTNGYPLKENSGKAIVMASNGRIYVGGNGGIAVFSPVELAGYKGGGKPKAVISAIESLRSPSSKSYAIYDSPEKLEHAEFRHNSTSVRVKISSLNYLFQPAYRYAYMVQGVDVQWNYIDRNDLILSNLPYGKHLLRIRISNEYGVWSDLITEQTFYIIPPIWLSTSAKALYFILVITLITFIFKYVNDRRTSKYRRLIDQIEKDNIEKAYKLRIDLFTQFSHELRTPLTLITAPTEDLLGDSSLPEKFVYPIRQIDKNANKILLLVNQLLDFRKIENGNMKLRLSKVDCCKFLSEQADNFRPSASKRNIELVVMNEFCTDSLWADADLLDRVASNLISNAIKNSPDNSKVEIGTARSGNNSIVIYVRDYGSGIAEANQEKIFEPFYQVPTKKRLRSFGSGIGLTLVKYVVNLHKGRVWVESKEGEGSKFIIELPLGHSHYRPEDLLYPLIDKDDNGNSHIPVMRQDGMPEPDESTESGNDRIVILIAEDDDELRNYIQLKFGNEYSILEAADGVEAFEQARMHIPDLIISDVMMPQMDGVELCRRIKEDIATAHIPVILLTAKSETEQVEEGYRALADDYVLKPFSSKILRGKINSLILNRARLREHFSASLNQADLPVSKAKSEDPFLNKLVELIKSRIEKSDLSVNDLYPEMGISRAQFFRKVKAISDISPNKLIVNIKMSFAADMLREGDLSISEVAYKLGYSDPSYFSKVFKSIYNISPTDYLRKHS